MAFQQPQRHVSRPSVPVPAPVTTNAPTDAQKKPLVEESQEWVLFSPGPQDSPDRFSESVSHTQRTAGRSRLSDFGSLDTAADSNRLAGKEEERLSEQDAETEDLDSLDDGLHAFNEPTYRRTSLATPLLVSQSADTVFPSHDGLGTFPGNSSPVQEQFWQHERFNPRRRRYSARRSNIHKRLELSDAQAIEPLREDERHQRIEDWRMEQSRALLEDLDQAARRRRRRGRQSGASSIVDAQGSRSVSASALARSQSTGPSIDKGASPSAANIEAPEPSFWERLSRRVCDLIGIDDATLSYIFGEALPPTDDQTTPLAEILHHAERTTPSTALDVRHSSWEERLIARIARELGIFVHQFSDHPATFNAYLRSIEQETPYAGLPALSASEFTFSPPKSRAVPSRLIFDRNHQHHTTSPLSPTFAPSMQHQQKQRRPSFAMTDPSLWGIDEEEDELEELTPQASRAQTPPKPVSGLPQHRDKDREYWEKELDVKMIFNFLRNRISPPTSTRDNGAVTSSPSRASSARESVTQLVRPRGMTRTMNLAEPDALRRAALIRHQHPLIDSSTSSGPASPARPVSSTGNISSPILGRRDSSAVSDHSDDEAVAEGDAIHAALSNRPSSSCASQSEVGSRSRSKRSKTAHSTSLSASLSLGGSRNFWDLGPGDGGAWGEAS